jgi:hypothetical protein
MPTLCCGHHRDPSDCAVTVTAPSTFSLTPGELRRHASHLAASGWQLDEITAVLDIEAVQS